MDPSLDTILQDNSILIDLTFVNESLSLLTIDNTRGYDTITIMGNARTIGIEDFRSILVKISQLNTIKSTIMDARITKLSMAYMNFGAFDSLSTTDRKIRDFPRNSGLRQITFENCWCIYYLIPILICNRAEEPQSIFDGISSLTHIDFISYDSNETMKRLSERLKNNYSLRSVLPDLSSVAEEKRYKSANKFTEYVTRNKQAYEKYVSTIITILGVRKYKKSCLSLTDKDSIMIICKMVSKTQGTYTWIDKSYSNSSAASLSENQ